MEEKEKTECNTDDIVSAFTDARTVYSILEKLKTDGCRCMPEQGFLLTQIMSEKSLDIVRKLRPYCTALPDSGADTVQVTAGFADPVSGCFIMNWGWRP